MPNFLHTYPLEDRARFLMQDGCMKHYYALILQLKCHVLMQDRCMKGADHATYSSAVNVMQDLSVEMSLHVG